MCSIAGLVGVGNSPWLRSAAYVVVSDHLIMLLTRSSANYHPVRRKRRFSSERRPLPFRMRRPFFWPCLFGAVFGASLADRASMCPSGCNGRGFCDDATCVCYPG